MKKESDRASVVLVTMPFSPIDGPSPALSILAASIRKMGIDVRCLYPGFRFAEIIGLHNYKGILDHTSRDLVGEWIFSHAAFPEFIPDNDTYFTRIQRVFPRLNSDHLWIVRERVDAYIDEVAQNIAGLRPYIVGCSSVFSQNCASLALLRRISELIPEVVTVMGGANCECDMGIELHERYQWVDYVFSGEADHIFPEFCRRVLNKEPLAIGGHKFSSSIRMPEDRLLPEKPLGSERVSELSSLPSPDYTDYFTALNESCLKKEIVPVLMMETSRGCWWGEIKSCSFCGVNGASHKYRVKDAKKAYKEITDATHKYGFSVIYSTDNCVSSDYFDTLFPMLSEEGLLMYFSIRPTITQEQCQTLSKAGARWVIAGIESLHDDALKLLNKGTTAFHNIRLLKWAHKYGIHMDWNYLMHIPGEKLSWYDEISELIPLIVHLTPPRHGGVPVIINRFSNYHNNPESFGLELDAEPSYSFIYPMDNGGVSMDNNRLAYYFIDTSPNNVQNFGSVESERFTKLLKNWFYFFNKSKKISSEPALSFIRNECGQLVIKDSRPVAVSDEYILEGLEAKIYEMCDNGATYAELVGVLCGTNANFNEWQLLDSLSCLIDNKILVKLSGYYLSLAVRLPTFPFYKYTLQ